VMVRLWHPVPSHDERLHRDLERRFDGGKVARRDDRVVGL
jgi:hypothetical protein